MKTIYSKTTFFILSLIFVAVIFFSLRSLKVYNDNEIKVTSITLENCDAQNEICTFTTQNFTFEISMDKAIYYLKPFTVSMRTSFKNLASKEQASIEAVSIAFKMTNMNMGVNRFQLKQSQFKDNHSVWKAKVILPVCVTGRADWNSELDIVTNEEHYRFVFPLVVKKSND